MYIGCILYADDILLISASVCKLQNMLDICVSVGKSLFLSFNSLKSQCISVGCTWNYKAADLMLDNSVLQWANKLKYLGVTIVSGRSFSVCLDRSRQKYFASANGLNAHCKFVFEIVKLQLFESYCLPILLYGVDCISLSKQQIQSWT